MNVYLTDTWRCSAGFRYAYSVDGLEHAEELDIGKGSANLKHA